MAGLSHMPGICSRLSWAQLPPVPSFLSEGGRKPGLFFCPGQVPGPEGIPDTNLGPTQERNLFCGHMWGVGDGDGSQILRPGHRRAVNHCATAGTEPGLAKTGGPRPSSPPHLPSCGTAT